MNIVKRPKTIYDVSPDYAKKKNRNLSSHFRSHSSDTTYLLDSKSYLDNINLNITNDSVIQSNFELDSRYGIKDRLSSSVLKRSKYSMLYKNFLTRSIEASAGSIRVKELRLPEQYLKQSQMELFKTKIDKMFAINRNHKQSKKDDERNFFFRKAYPKDCITSNKLPKIIKNNYVQDRVFKKSLDYNGGKVTNDKKLGGVVLDSYLKNLKDKNTLEHLGAKINLSENIFSTRLKDIGKSQFLKGQEATDLSNYGFISSKKPKGKQIDAKEAEKAVFDPETLIIKETVVKAQNLYAKPYTISEFFEIFARVLEDFSQQNKSSSCVPDLASKISDRNDMVKSFIDISSGRIDSGWNKFNITIETFGKSDETLLKKAALMEKFISKTIQDLIPSEHRKKRTHGTVKNDYFDNILTLIKKKKIQPPFANIPNSANRDDFCQKISRLLFEKYVKFSKDNQDNFDMNDIKLAYNNKIEKILDKELIPKTDEIYIESILRTFTQSDSPLKLCINVDEINKKLADLVEIRDLMELILLAKKKDYFQSVRNELKEQQSKYKDYSINIKNNLSLTMWNRLDMIETYENMQEKLNICKVYGVTGSKRIEEITNEFEDKLGNLDFYENKVRVNNGDINMALCDEIQE